MSNIPDRLALEDSDLINRLPIESEDGAVISERIDGCVGEVPLSSYSSINGDQSPNSFPEDVIVTEILPRLSVKALFRFKCVSKRYESIISDLKFAPRYLQPAYRSLDACSSLLFPFTDLSPEHNVKDLTAAGPERPLCSFVSLPHDNKSHTIMGSSNGLILSTFDRDRSEEEFGLCISSPLYKQFGLCISNPLTKQCVQLPHSTTLTGSNDDWFGFGIATRCCEAASSLLTYKIVSVRWDEYIRPATTTVGIFSSDTGRWVARELSCPCAALFPWNWKAGFAYKGILHVLLRGMGIILTYDPFDSPDRFGSIRLPKGYRRHGWSCLVYSGDEELVRYCEMKSLRSRSFKVSKVSVWRLVDSDKAEWCRESKFEVPAMPACSMGLMVAPNPWKCHLIYYAYLLSGCLMCIDTLNRNWKFVKVVLGTKHENTFNLDDRNTFIFIQTCPWSSPFYALPM